MSAEWQFLITLNERLRPLRDPREIQSAAVRLLCEHLGASRVDYPDLPSREVVAIIDACRRGETVVVADVATDARFGAADRGQLLADGTAAFVGAPLIKGGRWVATLGVHSAARRSWTRDEIALVEVVAERAWGAGERARAEETVGLNVSHREFLRHLNDTIRPLGDPDRILAETCRLLGTHLHVNRATYGDIDGDDCVIVNEWLDGLPSQAGHFPWRELGGSRTAEILNGGTLAIDDTSAGPHTPEERAALQSAGIGAYICPLLIKDGRFVGAFGIHSRAPRTWRPDEIALVEEVADRIWATLEHRRAEAELRAKEERLAFLLRLNDALRSLADPAAVQLTAAQLLGEHLGVARVGYAEIEGRKYSILREHVRSGIPLAGDQSGINIGAALRDALRRGEPVVVSNVASDPRLTEDERATMLARQMVAFVGTALFKDGEMVAAFGANHDVPRAWTASEVDLVRDVAARTWDAVERTRADAALREQRQWLRLAVDASAGGSWTWVAATNHVDWDERFRALYGFAPDEPATTDAWVPRVHEEDRPRILASLEELLTSATKDSWENTFRIVRPDGTTAWIQSRGRAERDAAGRLVRLTGLDLDFSQHRRAEEVVQAQRDEEHDRALRTLLETATQGIVSVDAQGTIATANHAFEEMFGWARGELIGEPIERLMPSAFRDAHARHRTGYFAAPHARLMGGGLNLVGQRRNGSTFPIEVSLNHVAISGGGRAFAFVTDITARERAASALRARTDELEYRTTQLSRMASELTLAEQHAREQIARTLHDGLQQLLVIVLLNLEQHLKREREAGAVPSELLWEAKNHVDEAIAAARSLNFELSPPVLQLSGLPAAFKWLANWTRDKYNLAVDIVVDPRADSARKDVRTLLFESVRELLFNAVKHANAERATVELALDAADRLCITVTDSGTGFDPSTLDDRSKAAKAGWGLFSIRERLTLLGGRVDVESAPGRGTRVRLVAPRGAAQAAPVPSLASIAPKEPASSDAHDDARPGALRILIVDDHAAVRTALREILQERRQFSVVGDASNGVEAIARAHALRPDVILMDVAMPVMNGVDATRRLRVELPQIQILGLSIQARTEKVHAIEQAGAARFFVKGLDTQRLIDHLIAIAARREALSR